METQTDTSALFVKMALTAWHLQNSRVDELLSKLTDEQLGKETAPGRNTGVYLFGHSIAVNDALLPLLGFGQRLYPEMEKVFVDSPDKSGHSFPFIEELKKRWKAVNDELTRHFNALKPEEWFQKHNAVSAEDFAKEPHRNRLNVIITRAIHQGYHLGQMNYLKEKKRTID